MPDWTPPTHVVTGTSIDSDKHNAEVVDNLIHLRAAQVTRLGKFDSLTIPNNSWTGVAWTYEGYDTMNAWSVTPHPERVYPSRAGFYRVSAQFVFPGILADPPGIRSIRLEKITTSGSAVITQAPTLGATRSTVAALSAIVEMNGTTDFLYLSVYQDSGSDLTSGAFANHHIDLEWIGA